MSEPIFENCQECGELLEEDEGRFCRSCMHDFQQQHEESWDDYDDPTMYGYDGDGF